MTLSRHDMGRNICKRQRSTHYGIHSYDEELGKCQNVIELYLPGMKTQKYMGVEWNRTV